MKTAKYTLCLLAGFAALFSCYLFGFNYTEPTQIGIARNWITGNMWIQEKGGWHLTSPFVQVARIDTRPMRVAVASAGHGYSAKLVQFNPKAWKEFVEIEGFHYYWWHNRISINFGYSEEYRGFRDIMRGHAYGAEKYPFLTVLEELGSR